MTLVQVDAARLAALEAVAEATRVWLAGFRCPEGHDEHNRDLECAYCDDMNGAYFALLDLEGTPATPEAAP